MTASADAARERRWKARGHTRLTARIHGDAHDALVLLAAHFRLDQRQVVEGLLLAAGQNLLGHDDTDLIAAMRDYRMSREEAEFMRAMARTDLTSRLTRQGERECAP